VRRAVLCWWLVAGGLAATPAAAAPDATAPVPESPSRNGFFIRIAPNLSYLWLSSNANVFTGFQQEIPSTAYAPGYGFEFQIGREVWGRVSLAAVLGVEFYPSVRGRVADQTVSMKEFQLHSAALGFAVTAFPFEDLGWSTAVGAAWCTFGPHWGDVMEGACFTAMGGYEWQVSRAWWLGIGARTLYVHAGEKRGDQSMDALSPGLVVTATYY